MTNKKKRKKAYKKDEAIWEIYLKALDRLAAEYGIEPGDGFGLLLRLAGDHIRWFPRFKVQHDDYGGVVLDHKGGRPAEWTAEKLDGLVADVERVKKENGFDTDEGALKHLTSAGQWAPKPRRDPDKWRKTLKNALARARKIERKAGELLAEANRLLTELNSNPEN